MPRCSLQVTNDFRSTLEITRKLGLDSADSKEFRFSARPGNLHIAGCNGFDLNSTCYRHRRDALRRHVLAFEIQPEIRLLCFLQPGVFLESFEHQAGVPRAFALCGLRTPFFASADSKQWLRVWRVPQDGWLIEVEGPGSHMELRPFRAAFLDLSLADLGVRFSRGGHINIRLGDVRQEVASFACRLVPVSVALSESSTDRTLTLGFAEAVTEIQLHVRDLISDQSRTFEATDFAQNDSCEFGVEGLGRIEVRRALSDWVGWEAGLAKVDRLLRGEERQQTQLGPEHLVLLRLAKVGWSPGLWSCELFGRRGVADDWQPIAATLGEQIVLLHAAKPDGIPSSPLMKVVWEVWSATAENRAANVVFEGWANQRTELLSLLTQMLQWRSRGFHSALTTQFAWVAPLCDELSHIADALSHGGDGVAFVPQLLNLATGEQGRDFFAQMPSLLALPGDYYRDFDTPSPLLDALAWCGRLRQRPTVAAALRDEAVTIDASALSCFGNFAFAAAGAGAQDLTRFDLGRYMDEMVGPIPGRDHVAPMEGPAVLGRGHALGAFEMFRARPIAGVLGGLPLALVARSNEFQQWLRQSLGVHARVVPASCWHRPWLHVEAEMAAHEMIPQFASVFALAARCAAAEWIPFEQIMVWLEGHAASSSTVRQAIASIVSLAPELVGYHLMLWELMIRTYPHD